MNLETLGVLGNEIGIADEKFQIHTDDSGYCGVTIDGLTVAEYRKLIGVMVSMDPYAVGEVSVDRRRADDCARTEVELRYGDTNPGAF